MGADQHIDWHGQAASALEWWHDAGVDLLVEDVPRDWFAVPPPTAVPVAVASPRAAAALAAVDALPDTLDAFVAWRASDAAPEATWNVDPIPFAAVADAPLMVLADIPEEDDSAEAGLLTGPVGVLLDRMLAAIGLSRAEIAVATIAAARPLTGHVSPASATELYRLARHHVTLARPRRLLLLGDAPRLAMLGEPVERGALQILEHGGIACPTIATFHPRFLLAQPRMKAEAWRHLQLLIRDTEA
ncbi:uracil-DNA glycosylase family protein [Sphingomonas sp. CFBP 13720]|uniref:uracil-DNA glycosylase family protein n=1 Tax=Sphingomonas sp. CFBP 13720 TaxID=2775302 RepID=UPI001781F8BC|nr:uracil-DNA glycosylase family protein [Sphingomonas sp. CFBP 13720]MBD8678822.1 uracil-DNA glycosylase [Sphingomonas sp. CFBP 13720]